MKSRQIRYVAMITAIPISLAGVWISYELSLKHLKIPPQDQPSFLDKACTAFETSSCEEVIKSPWGYFPPRFEDPADKKKKDQPKGDIPTAVLGLVFFISASCWFVLIGTVSPSRWWVHLLPTICTVGAFMGCAFLFYQMQKLDYWCPLCSATHLATLLLLICTLLMWPPFSKDSPDSEPAAVPPPKPDSS